MIYIDSNVVMYAVGRPHHLRDEARERLATATSPLLSSAEVLQELMHAYLPVGRYTELDAAFTLVSDLTTTVDVTARDVHAARALATTHPGLGSRDLLHLALALRYKADELWTYDRALAAAFTSPMR